MPKRRPGARSPEDINSKFGARLRTCRERAGRSQTDVGHALGVSFQQVQKYENGTTSISLNRLDELARYFATPVGQLVGGLEDPFDRRPASGFAESEQARYEDAASAVPDVGRLSREAVALVNAFDRIKSRKLRRSILTMIEAYGAHERPDASDSNEDLSS